MDTNISTAEFDIAVDAENEHQHHNETDAEAALEALRAAIGSGGPSAGDLYGASQAESTTEHHGQHAPADSSSINVEDGETTPPLVADSTVNGDSAGPQTVASLLDELSQLSQSDSTLMDQMNSSPLLQTLPATLHLLVRSNKKQIEIIKSLQSHLANGSMSNIDPVLTGNYVLKSEYDDLKARYDLLNASTSVKKISGTGTNKPERKARAPRAATILADVTAKNTPPPALTPADDNAANSTRKRRSMKLEHLIHKMANRRLGVEYNIAEFKTPGSKDLPDSNSIPPSAAESLSGVDEYRPVYGSDPADDAVKPFIDQVVADVTEAWEGALAAEEPEVDSQKIKEGVAVYWLRLCKRWAEQQARNRGEVHKDELTRRKQNTYRRQQSLLARRVAAFDASPLNTCKLRALYRTLLTIEFAPPTNERPDPNRAYTDEEWHAYQRLANGGRAPHAHEVVDQFWWSPTARALLQILDVSAADQNNKSKRKGKPKQPSPTFHLPAELWDHSTLPKIRPKTADGLPQSGQPGIVLFRFQVDEMVMSEHPEWAEGLYDNPPVPDEDILLPNLSEIMEMSSFSSLKPAVKALRDASTVQRLSNEEVVEVNSRPTPPPEVPTPAAEPDTSAIDFGQDFVTKSLDSIFAMNNNAYTVPAAAGSTQILPEATMRAGSPAPATGGSERATQLATPSGPSMGSSVRARRQSKRMANELPGGAALPVAKRTRKEGMSDIAEQIVEKQVEEGIKGDIAFLESI